MFDSSSPLLYLSVFDLVTLSFIAAILFLSLLSLSLIVHLFFKSRRAHHLQNFNSLWTVRLLLVFFVSFWAINELFRLPFFRRQFLTDFLHSLTRDQHKSICKIHVVLSLGLFEPAFLVTLLFLVNVSIKKKNPDDKWAVPFVFASCVPVLALQLFFLFFWPWPDKVPFPRFFQQTAFNVRQYDGQGHVHRTVVCKTPLLSTIMFAAFGVAYSLGFLLSCFRAVSVVINKGLRVRIYILACAVLIPLPVQIISLALSAFWTPEVQLYGGLVFVAFLSVLTCAAVGEGILIVSPISDALAAGGDCCRWGPSEHPAKRVVEK